MNGISANLIQVLGAAPINNFALCDLTLDAQANNASEDWSGSLIMDSSGGVHDVYSDIAEVGFFGPSTSPRTASIWRAHRAVTVRAWVTSSTTWCSNNTVFELF